MIQVDSNRLKRSYQYLDFADYWVIVLYSIAWIEWVSGSLDLIQDALVIAIKPYFCCGWYNDGK